MAVGPGTRQRFPKQIFEQHNNTWERAGAFTNPPHCTAVAPGSWTLPGGVQPCPDLCWAELLANLVLPHGFAQRGFNVKGASWPVLGSSKAGSVGRSEATAAAVRAPNPPQIPSVCVKGTVLSSGRGTTHHLSSMLAVLAAKWLCQLANPTPVWHKAVQVSIDPSDDCAQSCSLSLHSPISPAARAQLSFTTLFPFALFLLASISFSLSVLWQLAFCCKEHNTWTPQTPRGGSKKGTIAANGTVLTRAHGFLGSHTGGGNCTHGKGEG